MPYSAAFVATVQFGGSGARRGTTYLTLIAGFALHTFLAPDSGAWDSRSSAENRVEGIIRILPPIGTGTGSEIRQPLGYALGGGLVLSQVLTLCTTPVIYLYLERLRLWIATRWVRRGAAPTPETLGACSGQE